MLKCIINRHEYRLPVRAKFFRRLKVEDLLAIKEPTDQIRNWLSREDGPQHDLTDRLLRDLLIGGEDRIFGTDGRLNGAISESDKLDFVLECLGSQADRFLDHPNLNDQTVHDILDYRVWQAHRCMDTAERRRLATRALDLVVQNPVRGRRYFEYHISAESSLCLLVSWSVLYGHHQDEIFAWIAQQDNPQAMKVAIKDALDLKRPDLVKRLLRENGGKYDRRTVLELFQSLGLTKRLGTDEALRLLADLLGGLGYPEYLWLIEQKVCKFSQAYLAARTQEHPCHLELLKHLHRKQREKDAATDAYLAASLLVERRQAIQADQSWRLRDYLPRLARFIEGDERGALIRSCLCQLEEAFANKRQFSHVAEDFLLASFLKSEVLDHRPRLGKLMASFLAAPAANFPKEQRTAADRQSERLFIGAMLDWYWEWLAANPAELRLVHDYCQTDGSPTKC